MKVERRVIAINLPQFHPFKENNEWWGMGFTEWTNVTKAKPRYEGHYQPHLPADMGFYDLRLPEARQLQADLAKENGIYGFCYYHYWFNGKQLMERPVNEIIASGEPDFPFMLCWANENWARNWDGGFKDVLIKQEYSHEDDVNHMRWLCEHVFSDKRYIRVDGKPVFMVYRSSLFPDFEATVRTWRQVAREEYGLGLYLLKSMYPGDPDSTSLATGVDAVMDFQPIGVMMSGLPSEKVRMIDSHEPKEQWPTVYNYSRYVDYCCATELPDRCYPCVSPGFDNSPRRIGRTFLSFTECTPENFGRWLFDSLCRKTCFGSKDENFVFINAWNEWAEGNHLEPDQKWGRDYLEETRQVIDRFKKSGIPDNYEAERQAKYQYVKETVILPYQRRLERHQAYSACKSRIKNPSVANEDVRTALREARDALPFNMYAELMLKYFIYRIAKIK